MLIRHVLGRLLLGIGVILLALMIAVLLCEWLGWPFLRVPLQRFMQQKLERNIYIEKPFQLRLLGGIKLKAAELTIGAPEEMDVPYLVHARDLNLVLRYGDVWNLQPDEAYTIQSIQAEHLLSYIHRLADGRSTWQFDKTAQAPIRPFPHIQSLVIGAGLAHVEDALTQADLEIRFKTDKAGKTQPFISTIEVDGNFRERTLSGALLTKGHLPLVIQRQDYAPLSTRGWLQYGALKADFRGEAYDLFGAQNVKGGLTIQGDSLGTLGDLLSITLPRTKAFSIRGRIEKTAALWQVQVASARIGRSELNGRFAYDSRPKKAALRGHLAGKRLLLADLAPAFGGTDDDTKRKNRIFPDKPLDFATYNRMDAMLTVHLDYVDLGKAFREPIAPLKARLDLNKNRLSLAQIDARTARGSISGDIFIDAQAQKAVTNPQREQGAEHIKAEWGINIAVRNIDLQRWINVSKARKQAAKSKTAVPQAYVTGILNGKAALKGKGNSTAQVLRSLQGTLSAYVQHGAISHLMIEAIGLDIAQATGLLIKGDEHIRMQCAVMDFKAEKGVLTPHVALVDTPVTTVVMQGNLNAGKETLNLEIHAQPKNFSPFTVRSPIRIRGTFLAPDVSIKTGPIGARIVGGILLGLVNPLAAVLPFLDPGEGSSDASARTCKDTLRQLNAR